MFNLTKTHVILAILSILALAILIISLSSHKSPTPTLLSSHPNNGVTGVSIYDKVNLQFDLRILIENITISSQPTTNWTLNQTSLNSISLTHNQPLKSNTKHTITVTQNNKFIAELNFTTSPSQTDHQLLQNIANTVNRDYPLAQSTPYETNYLRVVYISPMTLEITLKNNSLTKQEAIAQTKSWVTKNGGNASTHEYQVIPATL